MENEHISSDDTNKNSAKLCQPKNRDFDEMWFEMVEYAHKIAAKEPQLKSLLQDVVFDNDSPGEAIASRLARKLAREDMSRDELQPLLCSVFVDNPQIVRSALSDMLAIYERDPACQSPLEPLLFFKGFFAISSYRASHHFWKEGRKSLALYLQSICSEVFGVDIHPAAQIGCGILLDHATSVVVGETSIIEDDVSILHEVTLGGTGKQQGNRHPIVRSGVLIGAGSKILGRVEIGSCAKIGAGSVVLADVAPHKTVAGVPAVVVGESAEAAPALEMDQSLHCSDDQVSI